MTLIHGYFSLFKIVPMIPNRGKHPIYSNSKVVVVSLLIHLNVQASETSVYKACKRENQALGFTGKFISKKKLKLHRIRACILRQ